MSDLSRVDQLIEQLAFGRAMPKPSGVLGLYLSPEAVYISETHRDKSGRLVVDQLVRVPIPSDEQGPASPATLSTDFIADPTKVAELIRQSMAQFQWNSKSVRVTLSHHLGLLRYFTMPSVEKRFLKSAVPLEAKKYIPIPFDVLTHDFQVMPLAADATGRARLGVLVAVAQKQTVANVQGLLKLLGLTLDGLEVAPSSTLRLWQAVTPPENEAAFMQVHIDGGNIRIMVCDRGVPVFFREVFLGAAATLDDLRRIDVPGCLSFVQKQLEMPSIPLIRVSGNPPNIEEFRAAFSQETGMTAVIQDAAEQLAVKGGEWGGYASLGASAHALVPSALNIDLAGTDRVSDEERQTARDVIIAAGALALVLAGAGLFKTIKCNYRARELRQYKIDADVESAIQGLEPAQIETQLKEMRLQLDKLEVVTGNARPKTSSILKEVIAVMPEKVWLSRVTVKNPLLAAEKQPFEITLGGQAQDRAIADEQALAFQFKENLLKSPLIGKFFEVQISVRKGADEADGEPKVRSAKLAARTTFNLTLRSKR